MTKEILISGSTGFIGKELIKKIINLKYKIKCISRKKPTSDNLDYINASLESGFPDVDVSNNTTLIHLAWNNVRKTNDPLHITDELDIQFNFIEKAVNSGVQKVIVAGSCYEYGMVYGPIDVNHPTNPITSYGLAKTELFKKLKNLQSKNKFSLIWPRIFYIYGDDDDSGNIISQFDQAIKDGDKVFSMSHGEQILDYLHVSDVADKLIRLIEYDDGIYNICSGQPISIRRLIETRKKIKKSDIKLDIGKYPYRQKESMAFWGIPNV